jgi:Protein of unknown function (Hypoth_ymh)
VSGIFWAELRLRSERAKKLVAILEKQEEWDELLGPSGPQLAGSEMHPWVWGAAGQLWDDGHQLQAVQTAASHLFDVYLPKKLGVPKGTDPEKMVADAFSESAPKLMFGGLTPGSRDWTNTYRGAANLGRACSKLVRNLRTHATPGDEPVLLEELAMLSRFARLVDEGTL